MRWMYFRPTPVNIVYFLLLFTVVVDSFNGYAIRELGISVSLLYKGMVLLACLLQIKNLRLYVAVIATFLFYSAGHLLVVDEWKYLIKSTDWLIKFAYIVVTFIFYVRFYP